MIIENKTVIKALKTENLGYGWFFRPNGLLLESLNAKECKVCAVGAIIRKSLGRKVTKYNKKKGNRHDFDLNDYCSELTDHQYSGQYPQDLLRDKNYLGALSSYFESFGDNGGYACRSPIDSSLRLKLVEFVKKNFPTRFKVKDFETLRKDSKIEDVGLTVQTI